MFDILWVQIEEGSVIVYVLVYMPNIPERDLHTK